MVGRMIVDAVTNDDFPYEDMVFVRWDGDQEHECVISHSASHGKTSVTFGPTKPASHYRDESLVINALRALVAPEAEL